jgi:hypothetical protein
MSTERHLEQQFPPNNMVHISLTRPNPPSVFLGDSSDPHLRRGGFRSSSSKPLAIEITVPLLSECPIHSRNPPNAIPNDSAPATSVETGFLMSLLVEFRT